MIFNSEDKTSQQLPDSFKSENQGTGNLPQYYTIVGPETDKEQAKTIKSDRIFTNIIRYSVLGAIVLFIILIIIFLPQFI